MNNNLAKWKLTVESWKLKNWNLKQVGMFFLTANPDKPINSKLQTITKSKSVPANLITQPVTKKRSISDEAPQHLRRKPSVAPFSWTVVTCTLKRRRWRRSSNQISRLLPIADGKIRFVHSYIQYPGNLNLNVVKCMKLMIVILPPMTSYDFILLSEYFLWFMC